MTPRSIWFAPLICLLFVVTIFGLWGVFEFTFLHGVPVERMRVIYWVGGMTGAFLTSLSAVLLVLRSRARHEKELFGYRENLANLLTHSADAILGEDREGKITAWNRGAELIFGYDAGVMLGRDADVLVPPDLRAAGEPARLRREVADRGIVRDRRSERLTRDGRRIAVQITASLVRDDRGSPVGQSVILRDVTQAEEQERELIQKEGLARIGELAAAVAHQIKNPLAGIGGALQVLSDSIPPGDGRHAVMEEVLQEIRRLDLTVRDLLYFARPRKPELETFPLRPLVEKIRSVLREEPVMQKITVRCGFPPDLTLRADPSQLEEVFMNLFLNAAQAMKQGGEIEVAARPVDGRLELSVADQGEGIPSAIRGEIFRPFFSTKNRGSGLGLSIVRKVVEAHGGDLRVDSTVGRGSTFTVSLPMEKA